MLDDKASVSDKASRHAQRKAATHQRLLDAARDVIVEKGYSNVEILDITERADVSKATFYQHFSNKEECARKLMHQGFDSLAEKILGETPPRLPDPDWVIDSMEQIFGWADTNREIMLIMVGGAASTQLNVFGRNYMVEITERTIINALNESHAESPKYSPHIQAQVVTGVLIQLLGWWLENETGLSTRQMGEMIHDILQNGLGTL
ncbi:MAG: TetR/AcrR family transcriptional regulator [Chloroflexi bacterium]|nr:TetR/AcrR family transcriptional regulator [Chloroflexota bacterium]